MRRRFSRCYPPGLALRKAAFALSFCIVMSGSGCHLSNAGTGGVAFIHEISFERPKVGRNTITFRLNDMSGQPITGARVQLEGNMTHPGMSPAFGEATEISPGRYQGWLDLSMAGDWMVRAQVTLTNGVKAQVQFEIKGVLPN